MEALILLIMLVGAVMQALAFAFNLLMAIVLSAMLLKWYRERCVTNDGGAPTGAYTLKRTATGRSKRVPAKDAQDEEIETALAKAEQEAIDQFWKNY